MTHERATFDPRAWIFWWIGASLPALLGRNPFMLVTVLLSILIVRTTLQPTNAIVSSGITKLFILFAAIGVLFNALTVHAGDIVLATIPDWVPIAGGEITLNAVVYGVLGAVAILTLVLAGLTVAENVDWSTTMRLIPDSFVHVGAASSIAFSFFPQMIASFREIREARMLRGAPVHSPLDYASLIAPALSTGLDRAVTLSELLEVRSFGGATIPQTRTSRSGIAASIALVLLIVAAYLFATDSVAIAIVLAAIASVVLFGAMRSQRKLNPLRTRYRPVVWKIGDTVVTIGASSAVAATVLSLVFQPAAVRYEPYPNLDWPVASLPLLAGLAALIAPSFVIFWKDRSHG